MPLNRRVRSFGVVHGRVVPPIEECLAALSLGGWQTARRGHWNMFPRKIQKQAPRIPLAVVANETLFENRTSVLRSEQSR